MDQAPILMRPERWPKGIVLTAISLAISRLAPGNSSIQHAFSHVGAAAVHKTRGLLIAAPLMASKTTYLHARLSNNRKRGKKTNTDAKKPKIGGSRNRSRHLLPLNVTDELGGKTTMQEFPKLAGCDAW